MVAPLGEGQVEVEGIVGSQVFVSPEADFAVLRLDVPGQLRPVVTIGALAGLRVGETVRIIGRYEQHERYGQTAASRSSTATTTGVAARYRTIFGDAGRDLGQSLRVGSWSSLACTR
jgi:S1-C subfamily serine protease